MAPWWGPQPSEPEKALISLREHVTNAGSSALGRKLSRDEANQATGSLVALTVATVAGATGTMWSAAARRRRAAAEAERLAASRAGGMLGSTISAVASAAAEAKIIPTLKKGVLDAGHTFVDKHGDRVVAEASKAAARASDVAREAATRSQAHIASAGSSVLGRAVRLRRNVMVGGLAVVFVYAAGRATPGALVRWGRSGSGDGDGGENLRHRLHVPEAARDALNKAKQEAQTAICAITGSSNGSETSGQGAVTQGRQLLGGIAATATILACIQCANSRK